jgi:predicted phosphodiesterase
MQVLYPPEVVQAAQPEELQQTDAEARKLVGDLEAAILAFGHLHYPSLRPIGNLLLANISSVSLPADGDSRAKYAICQWERGEGWQIAHKLVAYDVQLEKDVLAEIKPPGWEHLAASL